MAAEMLNPAKKTGGAIVWRASRLVAFFRRKRQKFMRRAKKFLGFSIKNRGAIVRFHKESRPFAQIENVKLAILNNVKLLYWQAEKTLLKLQYESGYILREF